MCTSASARPMSFRQRLARLAPDKSGRVPRGGDIEPRRGKALDKRYNSWLLSACDRRKRTAKPPRVASAQPRRPRQKDRREPAVHRDAGSRSEEEPVPADPASARGGARGTRHRTCSEFKEETRHAAYH